MSSFSLFDPPPSRAREERDPVLRVAEVNRIVRARLEDDFREIWVEGEVSDLKRQASGHCYFTLNDEREPSQLRCVMFRTDVQRARAKLADGARVRLRGGLTLYEPRGTFQMIARLALPAGQGDLAAVFERIRKKLDAEGLFDPARKRKLPRFPTTVGVVTSCEGAAIHDVIRVARGRCPVRIVIADCRVQGEEGAPSIVAALRAIQRLPSLDVVIIGRGGGSAEDLWSFNDERVARAIAACRVPTVSGVGHEVDITISDLVADVRASTPSNAAEIVVPDRAAIESELDDAERRLARALETRLGRNRLRLERLGKSLLDPRHAFSAGRQDVEVCRGRMTRSISARLARDRGRLRELENRLARHELRVGLAHDRQTLFHVRARLEAAMKHVLQQGRQTLEGERTELEHATEPMLASRGAELAMLAARLDAMSPVKVLSRGYAIALHDRTGKALVRAKDARPGDVVTIRLHDGTVRTKVEDER